MSRVAMADLDGDALWSAMQDAAAGGSQGAAAAIAGHCVSGGSIRLGWIRPAPWRLVERGLADLLRMLGLGSAHGILPLATGGWSFAAQAVTETLIQPAPAGLLPALDSLEPTAIRRAIGHETAAPRALLAISASRATLETKLLVEAMRESPGTARLPLGWLSDKPEPPDVLALSPRGLPDQVAMLGAPLSMAFLTAAAAMDAGGLADAYGQLLRGYDRIAVAAVRRAATVRAQGSPLMHLVVPSWAGRGLRLWLLQLGRQVLCGKSARFSPWVDVVEPGDEQGTPDARIDLSALPKSLPGLLEAFYWSGIFIGALGLRASLPVAEHAHVTAYKERLPDARRGLSGLRTVHASELPDIAACWLASRPRLTRLHVVRYDSLAAGRGPDAGLFRTATGHPCEVHDGTAWNHHSFHAVYADPSTAVMLVVASPSADPRDTVPLAGARRVHRQIAIATHLALADRSMIFQLREPTASGKGHHDG
jgi:hypothetical protein